MPLLVPSWPVLENIAICYSKYNKSQYSQGAESRKIRNVAFHHLMSLKYGSDSPEISHDHDLAMNLPSLRAVNRFWSHALKR
jgi:hypothetical protein